MTRRLALLTAAAVALVTATAARPATAPIVLPLAAVSRPDGTLELGAYRGRVVYVDFWASWCRPCRGSFEWMAQMHAAYADRGLVIIAVNVDRDRARADEFLAATAPPFPVVFDPGAVLATALDLEAMPSSFLFGPDGSRVAAHAGFRSADRESLERAIVSLLPGASTP